MAARHGLQSVMSSEQCLCKDCIHGVLNVDATWQNICGFLVPLKMLKEKLNNLEGLS